MRKRVLSALDELLAPGPSADPGLDKARRRATDLAEECGCGAGAAALVVTAMAIAMVAVMSWAPGKVLLIGTIPALFVAVLVGKVLGRSWALIQLMALRQRLLAGRARSEAGHVHVH